MLLVGVKLGSVDRFDVFAQRAGIRVSFGTARCFANVRFLYNLKKISTASSIIKYEFDFTSFEWVRFWCLARSEALLKALLHPGNSHIYGFSPVCDLRCVFKFSKRE